MEAKLDKIFNLFQDKKNESLFELCVRQIVEIYKDSPSSIYYLLKKAMRLLFSTTKDSYLQLKHRQVAAGIIEKTYHYYTQRLQKFLVSDLEKDEDIDILSLFHMEKITNEDKGENQISDNGSTNVNGKESSEVMQIEGEETSKKKKRISKDKQVVQQEKQNGKKKGTTQNSANGNNSKNNTEIEMSIEENEGVRLDKQNLNAEQLNFEKRKNMIREIWSNENRTIKTIEEVKASWNIKVKDIDYEHMVEHEEPLFAREKGFYDVQLQQQRESRELEEQILSKMGLSAELNPTNLLGIVNSHFFASFSEKQRENSMLEQDSFSEAIEEEQTNSTANSVPNSLSRIPSENKKRKKDNQQASQSNIGEQTKKKIKTENNANTNMQNQAEDATLNNNENGSSAPEVSMKECLGLNLFVPFNNIFRQCLKNLLSKTWEIRHYSAMVLKGFLKENIEFLDFQHKIFMKDIDPKLLEENNEQLFFNSILLTLQGQLQRFIADGSNLKDKIENYLSRNLIIILLDQLTDYSGKKSDIMIRRVACEMVTLILKNSNYISDTNRFEFLMKIQTFLQRSIEKEGQRLITQTSLVLVTSLLNERQDLRREIFQLFRYSYEAILGADQDEDIVMHFAENFLIFVGEKEWISKEGPFLSQIISRLWNYVDIFDDISYNIKTILCLLQEFQRLGFMTEADFSPPHIRKLFKYFFHWEEEVRNETYSFLCEGVKKLKIQQSKDQEVMQLLFELIIRGLVVERSEENFSALINLSKVVQPHLKIQQSQKAISLLFKVAGSSQSCEKVVEEFCGLDLGVEGLKLHYNYCSSSLSRIGYFDNNIMRLQRVVIALSRLAQNYQSNLDYIQQEIGKIIQQTSLKNYHQHILLCLTLASQLVFSAVISPAQISNFFSLQQLEQLMDLKQIDMTLESISIVDQDILNYLNSIDSVTESAPLIKNSKVIQDILLHRTFSSLVERRTNYAELRSICVEFMNKLNNQTEIGHKLIQNMDYIIKNIDAFVEKCEDYTILIKMCSIYLYITAVTFNNQPLANLNLICRPLPRYIQLEKFQIISSFVSQTFLLLIQSIEKFETTQKLLKNSLSKVIQRKKFSHSGITDPEKYPKEFLKYASKCACFNTLLSLYVDKHGQIGNLSFIYDNLLLNSKFFGHIQLDSKWLRENLRVEAPGVKWDELENQLRIIYKLLESLMDLRQFSFIETLSKFIIQLIIFLNSQLMSPSDQAYISLEEPKKNKISKVARKILNNILVRAFEKNFKGQKQTLLSDSSSQLPNTSISGITAYDTNSSINYSDNLSFSRLIQVQNFLFESLHSLLKAQNQIGFELLTSLLEENSKSMMDYSGIFVMQVVKCLTSPNLVIKDLAFQNLGKIITSVFLQNLNAESTSKLSDLLQRKIAKGNQFILDFQNNAHFDYQLSSQPRTTLREYQLEGVKWLGFLTKYNLNGALCDDMGLGKTLQVLVVLQNEIQKDIDEGKPHTISLIIAPSSIVDHWYYEIQKYLNPSVMKPLVVSSKVVLDDYNRDKEKHRIMIASYNTVQRNQAFFSSLSYKFCILDEGHLIKNQKTKVAEAVRSLQAKHKFLLSGTPIQNNLQELWSIFDFLMPGYLGSSKNFRERFSKLFHTNILNFSDEKVLFSEDQNRVLQDLHKKVMPFILRRDKKLVLKELPPKIIQDYYCYMTESQQQLYDDLENNQIEKCESELQSQLGATDGAGPETQNTKVQESVLRMLSQMIQIVNHPWQCRKIKNQVSQKELQNGLNASGKFLALKQLLTDLGFEEKESIQSEEQKVLTTNKNKVLIFSRFKESLQLICELLLNTEFAHIKYLRLDGNVPVSKRYSIVNKFNEDSECKIMLLTTSVGGLGLNLTSANVVIMFDHNYNPMNDLQAIDRAHRIGQKNTLNVYRMITKDTLEEKIMGIQRFKINIANAIINLDNSSIANLKDSNLITLFDNMVQENGYNDRKDKIDEDTLATNKCNPFKKILAEYDLWVTDDINKEY